MSSLVVHVDLTPEQINIFTYDFNEHGFCGNDSSNCNQDLEISTLQQPKIPFSADSLMTPSTAFGTFGLWNLSKLLQLAQEQCTN